jgi:lipopolysaccharide biosynthesis protein
MRDVCLFAHFDTDDRLDNYVLWYLERLRELDFSIVFISASRLASADVARLRSSCHDVILRENAGLDFGSWRAGFVKHGSEITGRLLLANDSVYGPIGDLKSALDRLTSKNADFYGMVESLQMATHLQSWFLLFEPWVVRHEAFKWFWEQPFGTMSKKQIIAQGEVGLSRRLVAAGFRYEALYRPRHFYLAGHAFNPAHLLWRELLSAGGVPFVKIELLRSNPISLDDPAAILKFVKSVDPSIDPLIESHLARTVNDQEAQSIYRLYRRLVYRVIRRNYSLMSERRWAEAMWNTVKLEMLMLPVWPWRLFKRLCLRQDI